MAVRARALEEVGEPGAPALDAEARGDADVVTHEVEGQAEQGEEDAELEEEDGALGPAVFAEIVAEVTHAGGDP